MNERKRLTFTAIVISLLAILTGLFLGGDWLTSQAADRLHNERPATTKTVTVVEHSHDDIPLHKHIITTVVTTTETTPHGNFHDLANDKVSGTTPTPPPDQQDPVTPEITPAPTPPPDQQDPVTPEIIQAPGPTPIMTRGANEIWNLYDGFYPWNLTVPVGTTVTWVNQDTYVHNVKSNDGFFDGILYSGGSLNFTFTKPGIFSYHCEIHSGMGGTVTVE